jgi:uncharacterized pyridoxamine 5'-phosphate oxidase family protein
MKAWFSNNQKEVCSMEEVIQFLTENRAGFLASVDNGKPRVRPFGFMFEEKGKFYFCTNTTKDVYKQLKSVPYMEFSCANKEFTTWLRLTGQITFTDDRSAKEKMLQVYPRLKDLYKSADNPILTAFYVEHGTAAIWSFGSQAPKRFEF